MCDLDVDNASALTKKYLIVDMSERHGKKLELGEREICQKKKRF